MQGLNHTSCTSCGLPYDVHVGPARARVFLGEAEKTPMCGFSGLGPALHHGSSHGAHGVKPRGQATGFSRLHREKPVRALHRSIGQSLDGVYF